jgi:hypothetical protein
MPLDLLGLSEIVLKKITLQTVYYLLVQFDLRKLKAETKLSEAKTLALNLGITSGLASKALYS